MMGMNKLAFCAAFMACVASAATVSIDVLDATVKDKRVSGATVILQQTGEASLQTTTNANGKASFNTPKAIKEGALLIVKKEGFSDLVVQCPCDGLTYALSPVMKTLDGMRIVLSWGAQPRDLDAHLFFGDGHVYFNNKRGLNAYLDVDDTDSYGPETITIEKIRPNETYIYAVADYTNSDVPSTYALSHSGAKVFVYAGRSLVKTYNVPQDLRGNVWTVFKIEPNGQITDLNAINGVFYDPVGLPIFVKEFANNVEVLRHIYDSIAPEAVDMNNLGEKAYHAGDIDTSIRYYQQAVNIDPNYAQAYSNMGLSYLKLNRFSESIWANRNAIARANGGDANTVRASSYYNIARLYERDKNYKDALRYYQFAKAENANPVYDKAIARMQSKL
jgi:tetratricopeptide (TPR) repeat protein